MKVNYIVIHCSASRKDVDYSTEQLKKDHLAIGFSDIGYHLYIRKNGKIDLGRALGIQGAHVKGYNNKSIGICYEGGLNSEGNAEDTRTEAQKQAILSTILFLKHIYPYAEIKGHRDFSKDLNGDGVITSDEYMKECPCFSVEDEYGYLN